MKIAGGRFVGRNGEFIHCKETAELLQNYANGIWESMS